MFVGHYAAGLALKGANKNASLGMLFLAVQFVDILFFPFVLLGIERFNFVENYTQSTHFELVFMPYTHSLVASLFWAGAVYFAFRYLPLSRAAGKAGVAAVMAVAVLSHWFQDLIVHTPDLPLLGDQSIKLGFGLWNHAVATYLLETVLLLGGLGIYLKSTRAATFWGKYGMVLLTLVMLAINAQNIFGPPTGNSVAAIAISALALYFLFAGAAFWLDGKRS